MCVCSGTGVRQWYAQQHKETNMTFLRNFGAFWYNFIIGDDWHIAATVVVALVLTALLVHGSIAAWWVLPLAVVGSLGMSLLARVRGGDATQSPVPPTAHR